MKYLYIEKDEWFGLRMEVIELRDKKDFKKLVNDVYRNEKKALSIQLHLLGEKAIAKKGESWRI